MEGWVRDPHALKKAITVLKLACNEGVATFSHSGGFEFAGRAPYGFVSFQLHPAGFADFECAANIPNRELNIMGFRYAMERWAPTESIKLRVKVLGNEVSIQLEFHNGQTGEKRTQKLDSTPVSGLVQNSFNNILNPGFHEHTHVVAVRSDKFAETVHFLNKSGERATIARDGGLVFSSWGYPCQQQQSTPNRTVTINHNHFSLGHFPEGHEIPQLNMALGFSHSFLRATQYAKDNTSTENIEILRSRYIEKLVWLRKLESEATYATFYLVVSNNSVPCQIINFIFNH